MEIKLENKFGVFVGVLLFIGVIALFGLFVMLLWNILLPDIFGLPVIYYWQAVCLLIFARIIFGGINGDLFKKSGQKGRFELKWERMSKEEKEAFAKRHGSSNQNIEDINDVLKE